MDQPVSSSKKWKKQLSIAISLVIIAGLGYIVYAAGSSKTIQVNKNQLDIVSVDQQVFEEGITVSGEIIPNQQTFLDASESGIVEKIIAKAGDELNVGDTIVQLSNSDLRLEVLQRESQLLEQLNNQRQTKILLNQNDLNQKQQIEEVNYQLDIQKRRFERNQQLHNNGVIADQDYEEIKKRYQYLKKRQKILRKVYQTDSLARATQLKQIDESENRLSKNLVAVQNILDKLCITSPVNGKLSDFELSNGERIDEGQRIGVVYNINPPLIEATIDELYINDIKAGLNGFIESYDQKIKVRLSKKFPGVEEGNFRVRFALVDSTDTDFYNGQSVRIKINLSAPKTSLVIPKGSFYSNTGGQWIFTVQDGKATKRQIELGSQNNDYYEVIKGLRQGEKVIISTYDQFMDYNQLNLKES